MKDMAVNDLNISFRDDFFKDKELFEYLGRSIYECQRLEITLAFVIQELRVLKDEVKAKNIFEYLRELKHIRDETFGCTLGRLFKELKRLFPELDKGSNDLLEKAIEKRNYIAHDFFFDNSIVMISPPYFRSVVKDDLKQSIEIISSAYKLSEKMLLDIRKRIKNEDDLQKKR
jgi:hypothetical protein